MPQYYLKQVKSLCSVTTICFFRDCRDHLPACHYLIKSQKCYLVALLLATLTRRICYAGNVFVLLKVIHMYPPT